MKPHIRLSATYRAGHRNLKFKWNCASKYHAWVGVGATPIAAYRQWAKLNGVTT